jgi:hypothetical protein
MSAFICHCFRHITAPTADLVLAALHPMMSLQQKPRTKVMWVLTDVHELHEKWIRLCNGDVLDGDLSLHTLTDDDEAFGLKIGDVEIYIFQKGEECIQRLKNSGELSPEMVKFLQPTTEMLSETNCC